MAKVKKWTGYALLSEFIFKEVSESDLAEFFPTLEPNFCETFLTALNHIIIADHFSLHSEKFPRGAIELNKSESGFPLTEAVFVYHLVLRDMFNRTNLTSYNFASFVFNFLALAEAKNLSGVAGFFEKKGLNKEEEKGDYRDNANKDNFLSRSISRYKKVLSQQGFAQIIYTASPFKVWIIPLPKTKKSCSLKPYGFYRKLLSKETSNSDVYEVDLDKNLQRERIKLGLTRPDKGAPLKLISNPEGDFFQTRVKMPNIIEMKQHFINTMMKKYKKSSK